MTEIELVLPYPPSVNHYKKRGQTKITKTGKTYQALVNTDATKRFYYEVWMIVRSQMGLKRIPMPLDATIDLEVCIDLHPPDNRRRDIDNTTKLIFDSLQRSGLIVDDNQIARLVVERMAVYSPQGKIILRIKSMSNGDKSKKPPIQPPKK